jgi:transcriptional regulator with GAF, ATPase, and Fis domain
MESEFFGHEKGSFTGAHARKMGKFEQADGGTIFLDEIGELDMSLQAKLLRVLQNQEVQRVGGQETLQVDVRVICATNKDIVAMTRDGAFREDLYYRLFQFPIHLPPLRDRDQDALLLARHFHEQFLNKYRDVPTRAFSAATRRFILAYPWPGNVRQLKNAVERALLVSDTPELIPEDLMVDDAPHPAPAPRAVPVVPSPPGGVRPGVDAIGAPPSLVETVRSTVHPDEILPLEELKRQAVLHAFALCGENVEQTSIRLGVTRSTVYRLLEKYQKPSETGNAS